MDNEIVKKLTGKNPKDFEFAAAHIINECDVEVFSALVEKSDFLFDFIKRNVETRLKNVITNYNYKNLLCFLKIHSHDYENLIVSTLVKYADEELTDEMLDRLENGADEEKAYAAKYFSHINDTLAIDLLRKYSYAEFDALALNCAEALSAMKDEFSYNLAVEKIKSDDDFEKLSAARFLVSYGDKKALKILFETLKNSSMPENIASEIPYLERFTILLQSDHKKHVILALNHILNGLGEIIPLSQIFDFELYEIFEKLINNENTSQTAVLLLNAKQKFEQLTENDEYIFDENNNIKEEVHAIKDFLSSISTDFWDKQKKLAQEELNYESEYLFFALELVQELNIFESFEKLKELLQSQNQTVILKTTEVIKSLGKITELDKNTVLKNVTDKNIKLIIESLF